MVSIVAIDPRTGQVKALVGGRDFGVSSSTSPSRAAASRVRPSKPSRWSPALRDRHVAGEPIFFSEPKAIYMGPGAQPWTVATYYGTYAGPTTLLDATVLSTTQSTPTWA